MVNMAANFTSILSPDLPWEYTPKVADLETVGYGI
jgi:hypothetical protein